jgi:DNA polymerase III subunit beta
MLFKINREDIFRNLQSIVSVIEKKQTIPILSNVLIRTENDYLSITGTDLEIQLVTRSPADVQREGATTVSARKFLDICRNLPESASVTIESAEGSLQIRSGRSRFRLGTLDPESYPMFSSDTYTSHLEIEGLKFLKLLQATAFCMAMQDVRYYLNGLMIEIEQSQIRAVASNGHRLALYKENLDQAGQANTQFILPRKGVIELVRLLNDDNNPLLQLRASPSNIEIRIEDKVYLSKLIDGKFPDFRGALSQPIAHSIVMDTNEFKGALSRVGVLSSDKFKKVTLTFSRNTLLIRTENTEREQADEEIDIVYPGDPYEVSMNISYLLEAISNIHNETVDIAFTENTDICLIGNPADSSLNYVVMPLV